MKNQPYRLLNGSVGLHNKFFITAFSHTSVQLPSFIFICSILSLNSSKKSKNSVLVFNSFALYPKWTTCQDTSSFLFITTKCKKKYSHTNEHFSHTGPSSVEEQEIITFLLFLEEFIYDLKSCYILHVLTVLSIQIFYLFNFKIKIAAICSPCFYYF